MTIGSTSAARASFACDGVTKTFPVPIQAYQGSDFTVILTAPQSAGGVELVLTLNSDYSLAPSGTLQPSAWSLTTLAVLAYATGYTLQIFVNPVQQQQTQYVQGQAFPSLAIQTNLDRLTQMVQRLQDQINRSVRAPDGDNSPGLLLPVAAQRPLQYLGFDASGNAIVVPALPGSNITRASLGAVLYPLTPAEQAALVTPTDYADASKPFLDSTRYGVVADGATDNAAALANFAAVLKQNPGYTGVLPGGTILCSSLTALAFNSTTGITLRGGSALNGTKLVYTGTGNGNFVDARSSYGFSMSYISLYHNNNAFTGNLISFSHDGSGNDAQHGHLFRCAYGSVGPLYTAVGIQLDQATLITVENCSFGALLRPIAGQNTAGGSYSVGHRIINNQFAGYGFYAIYYLGQGWKITGNNFQPNQSGLVQVLATNANTPVDGLAIRDNTVLDATGASVVAILYQTTGLEVSGNVVGCGGGSGQFLQFNGVVDGFSMRGNHISQGNIAIVVPNLAHNGWAINGNYFDTFATASIDHPEYVTGINLEGNFPDIQGRAFEQPVVVPYSNSMTFDASKGNYFTITPNDGNAFTINAPLNPKGGQRITVHVFNGNGAALGAATWNGVFKMLAWTQPSAGNNCSVEFRYNQPQAKWYQVPGVNVPS